MTETSENLAKLPLDGWHRAHGGRMVPFAGYEMPVQYEGIMAEHLWTREHAGLFDVSHMGQLLFHGPDVDRALETLLPGDLLALKDGRLRYSMLLAEDGGIIDDLMATRRGEHFYLVVNGATKHGDIEQFERRLPRTIALDHMKEQALLALQGPEAAAALEALVPGVGELSFMQAGLFHWNGKPLWISRSGYTGEDGFEISVAGRDVEALADALVADERVKPIGLGARDSLRLEAGLPLYGHDLDGDDHAGHGRPHLRHRQAPPRRGRLRRRAADHGRARQWPGAEARRPAGRGPPAGPRRRADPRRRGQRGRPDHVAAAIRRRSAGRSPWAMSRPRWPSPAPR